MKRLALLFCMFIGFVGVTMAQRTVTGTITTDDGEPLIGVNVIANGTSVGTITDLDGSFSLNVPEGVESLELSYTGFGSKTVDITGQNALALTLSEGTFLDEVVVTALGIDRNSREVVYANQTVGADELLSSPNKNTLEALRGKTAGVQLSTASGSVGASSRIVLRGPGSLTGDNNALIVVDGIPIDNSTSSGGPGSSTSGYADHGNRFNDINPDDIESVTILKGPSATSLYGSRGASGVVLITTKSGKDGKFKIGVNSSFSNEEAYILLQRQDRFGQGYDNSALDSGENWSWGPALDGVVRPWTSPVDADGDGDTEFLSRPYSNVDNQLFNFFNRGRTISNGFNLSGSQGDFNYFASYSNTDQKGILDNTYYKRNTVTVKGSTKFYGKLSTDFKVSYANVKQNTAQEGSRAFEGNNAYSMVIQSPVNIPFTELRDYKSPFHGIDGYWGSYSSVNPYYILNEYGNEANIDNVIGSASLKYDISKNLNVVTRIGTNLVNTNIETWTPAYSPATQYVWGDGLALSTRNSKHESLGEYIKYSKTSQNLDFSTFLNYNQNLTEKISLDGTLGYNWFQTGYDDVEASTNGGLVVPGWYNLKNSALAAQSDQYSELYRIYGMLGNVRLGYNQALFLELSARNDWSSTLPEANNSFLYGAVGASAIITELVDIDNNILNFMKVRASYGSTGKDAGLYLLRSSFVGNPTIQDLGAFTLNFPLNGQAGFTTGNVIGNPDLKPELTTTFEFGADFGFFQDRVNLAYTYYSANHSNQIVQISLPRSSGYTTTTSNIGKMTNKGSEITLAVKPIFGLVNGLDWELYGTFSNNVNEVVSVTDDIDELVVGGPYTPGVSIVAAEGLPFGTFKAQTPLTNASGQTIVDANTGFPLYSEEEQYLGSYQPDYLASLGSNVNYKGFGFNILFDIKQGGNFVSQTKFFTEFNGTAAHTAEYNRESYVFPNSVYENADGDFVTNDIEINEQDYFTNYDPAASTYIIDASFVKLREIGLSYKLPKRVFDVLPISDARISLFAKNVRFWLPEENIFSDPEVNGPGQTGNEFGIETTQTPPSRSIGVNLNLTF